MQTYNAGLVSPHQIIRHRFRIANPSEKAATVHVVQKSCACTSTAADGMQLPPGSSKEIEVSVNVGEQSGVMHSRIDLATTAGDAFRFEIEYQVPSPDLTIHPRIVVLNELVPGGTERRSVSFQTGRSDLRVVDVRSQSPSGTEIKWSLRKEEVFDASRVVTYWLDAHASQGATPGKFEIIAEAVCNKPSNGSNKFRVAGTILPEIYASPATLSWGVVKVGSGRMSIVEIRRSTDGEPLSILAARVSSPYLAAEIVKGAARDDLANYSSGQSLVKVTFAGDDVYDMSSRLFIRDTLAVDVAAPQRETIHVPISFMVMADD
ncbi:MAG: DUF1573 domain-containing protein [Planctomycetaceae bacterium]|nr:DUF1573 domain-containing protein [Planctomycetaceae bacterium]